MKYLLKHMLYSLLIMNASKKIPRVYEVLTREMTDERNNNQATDRRADGDGIQKEIRTLASNRGNEVDESTTARESGRTGIEGK